MSIKQKTINGLFWSFLDNFLGLGVTFVIGIILARLLSPSEFGVTGLITIFIAVSGSFINSGFSQALIRRNNNTNVDYSTVFYFNLATGFVFYWLLFFSSGFIASFYKVDELSLIIKVLGLDLIINAFTIIQRTTLTKSVNFKLQAKISVTSSIISGIVGIVMAYLGFGVWSLVAKTLTGSFINSALLWLWNKWRPIISFSIQSFKELFSFGYKLLISGLIDTIYQNIYSLIIGKYFSVQDLGYYTRAVNFNDLPSKNINGIISRVSYPVLAQLNVPGNQEQLKAGYKKLIKSTMLITFVLMMGMAAVAEPMIITLIGEKWRQSVIYLQLLCFVGMMYPLHALNLNMLNVKGRSDLFLRLEIIKKILAIPIIIIAIVYGIKIMIMGMWVNTLIAYYINSYYSGKLIDYPIGEQIRDILPAFLLALSMGTVVFFTGLLLPLSYFLKLIIQVPLGMVIVLTLNETFKPEAYLEIKKIVISKFTILKNGR